MDNSDDNRGWRKWVPNRFLKFGRKMKRVLQRKKKDDDGRSKGRVSADPSGVGVLAPGNVPQTREESTTVQRKGKRAPEAAVVQTRSDDIAEIERERGTDPAEPSIQHTRGAVPKSLRKEERPETPTISVFPPEKPKALVTAGDRLGTSVDRSPFGRSSLEPNPHTSGDLLNVPPRSSADLPVGNGGERRPESLTPSERSQSAADSIRDVLRWIEGVDIQSVATSAKTPRDSGGETPEGGTTTPVEGVTATARGIADLVSNMGNEYIVDMREWKPEDETASTVVGEEATRSAVMVVPKQDTHREFGKVLRTKTPDYGSENAIWEVGCAIAWQFFGNAPDVRLAVGAGDLKFNFSKRPEYEEGRDPNTYACVASTFEPGYKDLGTALVDQTLMHNLVGYAFDHDDSIEGVVTDKTTAAREAHLRKYDELLEKYNNAVEEEKRIRANPLETDNVDLVKAQKRIKLEAHHEMADMLPLHMRDEMLKVLQISQVTGNWDLANFELANIGFDFKNYVPEKPETIKTIKGMFVDFGNAGPIGFKGRFKEESGTQAEIDPRADNPVHASKFLTASKRFSFDKFDANVPPGWLALTSLPRHGPFKRLYKRYEEWETAFRDPTAQSSWIKDGKLVAPPLPPGAAQGYFAPSLEVAYRMSLIPDDVLRYAITKACIVGKHPWFPPKDPANQYNRTPEEIADIFVKRKNNYLDLFDKRDLEHWKEKYPDVAKQEADAVYNVSKKYAGKMLHILAPEIQGIRPAELPPSTLNDSNSDTTRGSEDRPRRRTQRSDSFPAKPPGSTPPATSRPGTPVVPRRVQSEKNLRRGR